MRKFITFVLATLTVLFVASCTSCKNEDGSSKFGIEYSLSVDGNTDGAVDVTFAGGYFNIDGASNFDFAWTNAEKATKLEAGKAYGLDSALAMKDATVSEAATRANDWLEENVGVKDFSGHYKIHIKGYIKETLTGLMFEVDRELSNQEEK